MKIKIIRTEQEYQESLEYLESLMDAAPGSPEEGELEVLAMLLETYEKEHYPIDLPDPIEAIQFRMEQVGLTRKDLIPYLGSQSKVSEVLNRKRPLSLSMIRALQRGLGIPAEVLLQEPGRELAPQQYDPRAYPLNEMVKAGYFETFHGSFQAAREYAEELLKELFSVFDGCPPEPVHCRKGNKEVNQNALMAWIARVLTLARTENLPPFAWQTLNEDLIQDLRKLSYYSSGPQLARELLHKIGIHLIVLPRLPKTYLDGACTLSPWGNPVIGMTLRFDRLDYFWFTLLHELAHLTLHLKGKQIVFFDDTEPGHPQTESAYELEANDWTRDRLIPPEEWRRSSPTLLAATQSDPLTDFAASLRISPAIVAGRVRWERENYKLHPDLIGNRKVREQFAEYEEHG